MKTFFRSEGRRTKRRIDRVDCIKTGRRQCVVLVSSKLLCTHVGHLYNKVAVLQALKIIRVISALRLTGRPSTVGRQSDQISHLLIIYNSRKICKASHFFCSLLLSSSWTLKYRPERFNPVSQPQQ